MTETASAAAEILERERSEFEARTPRSRERFRRALNVFPGGDTRIATNFEPYPAAIERADDTSSATTARSPARVCGNVS